MNILFCNYEYPPLGGGGGVVNAQVAQELAKRHKVTVLTSQGLGLQRESIENGVRVVRVPVFFRTQEAIANLHSMVAFIPMGIEAGLKLLKVNRFDVINTHFVLPSGPVGDFLAHRAGIPNVLSLHGGDLYDPSKFSSPHRDPVLRLWIRWLLRRADQVVGQSLNTLSNMRQFYTPEIQGVRIPLGINRPCFENVTRREYGFVDDEILLVTVGRLVRRKANEQLLALLKAVKQPGVRLLVVGSGPDEQFLREEAQKLELGDQVRFYGYVEDTEKFRLLQISDIYVSTSQHEGFCLSFLEAMSCGLPVISYDHGGHTDFLMDHTTGYLVPLNDLDGFVERSRLLIENAELRRKLGENNRLIVEQYYIDTCASMYESEFKKTIELKHTTRNLGIYRSSRASTD